MVEHAFVYAVVIPVSCVFAMRRIMFNDLRKDVPFWCVPMLVANYTLYPDDMSAIRLAVSMAVAVALFVALVLVGARLCDWYEARH